MKYLFSLLLFVLPLSLISQFNIKWSELLPARGRVSSIFPVSYSDFYTTRYQGSALFSSLHISKHANFSVTSSGKITSKLPDGIGTVEHVEVLKGLPVVFISDKRDGENFLFIQKYSSTCEPVGDAKKIHAYKMPKGWKRRGEYIIFTSKNKDFICLNYEIPGSKDEKNRFGYKVFDNDFELKSEGEYELPYPNNLVKISNAYLSNKGDFFFGATIYALDENKKGLRTQYVIDKVVLCHPTATSLEEFELALKNGKNVSNFTFSSNDDHIMTFTGLYGERNQNGIKGVFYFQLDYTKKEIISEGWNEFGKDFIMEDWTDREKEKAEKREAKGRGEPQLYEYDVRDILTLKDGSMIGILEQYYVKQVTTTDPRSGSTTTTYYYYFNDVIIYKINPNASFAWLKKVNKYQVSTNDNGYFSSIAYFVSNNKLRILFNDNLKNYDAKGEFLVNSDRLYPTSYRKKSNTVALVEIDLDGGIYSRRTFFNREETKAYAVPQKFIVDYNKNEMLLFLLYGKKEKYGILSFE